MPITRTDLEEHYLRPKGLRVSATSDVPDEAIEVFCRSVGDDASDGGERMILASALPPSFIHLLASLGWWQQIAVWGMGAVATGFLAKAGENIWDRKQEILKDVSGRIWSVADQIVNLQNLIEPRTEVRVAFPSKAINWPVLLTIERTDLETVAFQLAALCFHAPKIESFVCSEEFDPIASPSLVLERDGLLMLRWFDDSTHKPKERAFGLEVV